MSDDTELGLGKIHRENVKIVPFEKLLGRDIGILRLMGLHSMNSVFTDKIAIPTYWESIAFSIGWINLCFVVSCEARGAIEGWSEDPIDAIGAAAATATGFLCLTQGWRLWFWREELRMLFRRLAIMWDESKFRVEILEKNIKSASGTYFLGRCYILIVVTVTSSYAARPYITLIHYQMYEKLTNATFDYNVHVYPAIYPFFFKTEVMSNYILWTSWEQFVMIFVAGYCISGDVVFAQLTTHAAIQFRVLHHDLLYVTNVDDETSKDETIFTHRLSAIVKRHRNLYTYCELIERIYSPVTFLIMLLAGANMCFCAFRLQKEVSQRNWDEIIKSVFHTVTVVVQAFIYCGYADTLTQQSSMMAHAAYNCQWLDRSKEFKIMLQIIMLRSQKALCYTAYGFFSVNLKQITAIFNTAASFFALLKTMA